MKDRIPLKGIETATCQDIVITTIIDVLSTLLLLEYFKEDGGGIIGGRNDLIFI